MVAAGIGGKEKDMTREDIEKAALKGVEEYVNSGNLKGFRGSYCKGFMEGADWRINSVWHDAKEEPKYDEYFLYENIVHAYHVDGIYPSEDEPFVWDDYVKDWRLIRWAYIKDLIPNKEE